MSDEELQQLSVKFKEQFIARMRGIYGESDEFEQWTDALDLSDARPGNKEAANLARAALHRLIRTIHPDFQPEEIAS